MKHDSMYGTTCWFCGHPGTRTRRLDEGGSARACDDCRRAKGSADEVRANRNKDVEAIAHYDQAHSPLYWSAYDFGHLMQDYQGLPRGFVDQLRCQPFHDDFLELTKARNNTEQARYRREYYEKVGKEARRQLYQAEKARKIEEVQRALDALNGEKK